MTEITDQLSICGIREVAEESTAQFDHVVSVCQDTREDNIGCQYTHISLAEDVLAEINWGGSSSYDTFKQGARTVRVALQNDENVLVHCHHGQNRSVAVSAAAMAVYYETTVEEALFQIQQCRSVANPSETMREYAERYVWEQ